MKIIGTTVNGFLADITETEIANILGFYAGWEEGFKRWKGGERMPINKQFSVETIYKKTRAIRERDEQVKQAIKTFRGLADALEVAWPSLENIEEARK